MNRIPEEQAKKICNILGLSKEEEDCEGNHNSASYISREISTGKYEEEWKKKMLLNLIVEYYVPGNNLVGILRNSETEDEYYDKLVASKYNRFFDEVIYSIRERRKNDKNIRK